MAGMLIIGAPQATIAQAQAWAQARGGTAWFVALAPLYWRLAPQHGGVRPDIAYAQSAKETRYGQFGGVVGGPDWHNPCGLKTRQGGDNSDPNAHARFADDETGVAAHLDHLALYAGAPGYPRTETPDPRHFASIAGVAPTVEELGGRWAPAADYGQSIVADFLARLLATAVPSVPTPPQPQQPTGPTPAQEMAALRVTVAELQGRMVRLQASAAALQAKLAAAQRAMQ